MRFSLDLNHNIIRSNPLNINNIIFVRTKKDFESVTLLFNVKSFVIITEAPLFKNIKTQIKILFLLLFI